MLTLLQYSELSVSPLHKNNPLHLSFSLCNTFRRSTANTIIFYTVGLSKGVGFIRFDQRVEAERAIQKLNGTIPDGATEPITVKFANSPSSNKNGAALTPLTLAPYLPQTRRLLGPIHHPSSRFRFIVLLHSCTTLPPPSLVFMYKLSLSKIFQITPFKLADLVQIHKMNNKNGTRMLNVRLGVIINISNIHVIKKKLFY